MNSEKTAFALITRFEGCVLNAYPDPASGGDPWTVGYGATGPDIRRGVIWTLEKAETDLRERIDHLLTQVRGLVKVKLPEGCEAALVSFAYNVGIGALTTSTLLKKVNAGQLKEAADEFNKWTKAAGKVFPGLVKRRAAERQVFLDALKG
jgi:lysozyme